MGGEDFALLSGETSRCIYVLKFPNPAKGTDVSHHNPKSDVGWRCALGRRGSIYSHCGRVFKVIRVTVQSLRKFRVKSTLKTCFIRILALNLHKADAPRLVRRGGQEDARLNCKQIRTVFIPLLTSPLVFVAWCNDDWGFFNWENKFFNWLMDRKYC